LTTEPGAVHEAVYQGNFAPGWILSSDLPREDAEVREAGEKAVATWVAALLAAADVPREQCLWTAWNPNRIQLPAPWNPDEPGPLAPHWQTVRLFHERFELRLERSRLRLTFRLLTEDPSLKEATTSLILAPRNQASSGSKPDGSPREFQTLPGHVILAGQPVDLGPEVPAGARAEVQYPRLLVYRTAQGPGPTGSNGRIRVAVTRFFDKFFRLRATRYRSLVV